MTEEREEGQVVEQEPPTTQYQHLQHGEEFGELVGFAGPFRGAAGFLEVQLYYWVHEGGVLLLSMIVPPESMPRVWRRHWTSYLEACQAANSLAGEAEDYLRQMTRGHPMRDVEDLDYEDFVEHLMTRINGEFH